MINIDRRYDVKRAKKKNVESMYINIFDEQGESFILFKKRKLWCWQLTIRIVLNV
jgi:hypothetical protein